VPNHLSTPCITIMGWIALLVAGLSVEFGISDMILVRRLTAGQPATNDTPSMVSGNDDGNGNFIHF
jgi:hypothetical protein